MNLSKDEALARIAALADESELSADDIVEYLGTPRRTQGGRGQARLAQRILASLGGVFVLAGWLSAVDLFWAEMTVAARVLAVFGPGLAALVVGLATRTDTRFQAASTPLFLIAGLLQPTGLFILLDAYSHGGDPVVASILVFGVLALQWMLLFVWGQMTSQLFLSVLFAVAWLASTFSWLDFDGDFSALVIGVSGLLVTWRIDQTRFRGFAPLAWFSFAMATAFGAYGLLEGEFPFDFLLIGVAAGLIHLGVQARSRALLVAGVVSMLGYLGHFTDEYFADLLSWPIALIVTGLLMLGVSGYALRLGERIARSKG